jgi:hypothetical protein
LLSNLSWLKNDRYKIEKFFQVALHLFQAGANQVKLGIQKPAHLPPPPPSNQIIGVI